jgi:hypothetical protein
MHSNAHGLAAISLLSADDHVFALSKREETIMLGAERTLESHQFRSLLEDYLLVAHARQRARDPSGLPPVDD